MYNINRFVLQESGDFTWRVSDCEELVCVQIEFIHPFFGYLCYRDTMFA